ncbi:MAG: hypothetical protein WCU88_00620 [Elusimicrobiota bacterium]|jgi:hypothetical protein
MGWKVDRKLKGEPEAFASGSPFELSDKLAGPMGAISYWFEAVYCSFGPGSAFYPFSDFVLAHRIEAHPQWRKGHR